MNKCYLEDLPHKKGVGKTDGKMVVDWISSVGYTIPFIYKGVQDELKIVDYNTKEQMLTIEYDNETSHIATSQIHNCSIGRVLKVMNKNFIYKEHQILDKNGKGLILNRFRKGKNKTRHYLVKCLDCGGKYSRSEGHLKERGVKCPNCGDGVSYPTKFIHALLLQVGCSFEREFTLETAGRRRYDFYIVNNNSIIEVHGSQHYINREYGSRGRTLKEEQSNDALKKKIALDSGIGSYKNIDARESSLEWIKSSVLNSKLSEMFDLSNIDWEDCHKFAMSNLIAEICSKFKENSLSTTEQLSKEYGIHRGTVVKYLKKGAALGWCDYNPKTIQTLNGKNLIKTNSKPIICLETGQEFESARECERLSLEFFGVRMLQSKISAVCNGLNKTHKGYTFRYKNLNDIKLDKFRNNILAKEICQLKSKNHNLTTGEIAKEYNLSRSVVRDYLIKGSLIGWCSYHPSEESRKSSSKVGKKTGKKVEVFKNGISLGVYNSTHELAKISELEFGVRFIQSSISNVCIGKIRSHKGYIFKYI